MKKLDSAGLPEDSAARKKIPLVRGLLDYFPAALAEVAATSVLGNEKHNPGQELHWSRGKSNDHADCIVRHVMARGTRDSDGVRHSAHAAWRALAMLQLELEAEGAPLARGARVDPIEPPPPAATTPTRTCTECWGEGRKAATRGTVVCKTCDGEGTLPVKL